MPWWVQFGVRESAAKVRTRGEPWPWQDRPSRVGGRVDADYSASLREAPETGELEDAGRLVHLCGIPGDDGRRVTPRGLEDRVEPPVAPPGRRRRMR